MTSRGASILDELEWRELIAQSTDRDALAAALAAGPVTVYSGFDPTAPSLHAGHLIPLLTLTRFQGIGRLYITVAEARRFLASATVTRVQGRSDG